MISSLLLVMSGPEAPGVANRDTRVVVRELFANAQVSVLVAGYAIYQGKSVSQDRVIVRIERTTMSWKVVERKIGRAGGVKQGTARQRE